MPIRSLTVDESAEQQFGLGRAVMSRIGRYVAIAGANGSGKTRLLKYMQKALEDTAPANRADLAHRIDQLRKELVSPQRRDTPANLNERLSAAMSEQARLARSISCDEEQPRLLRFVPKAIELVDPSDMAPNKRRYTRDSASGTDLSVFHEIALPYIQTLQDEAREASHPDFALEQADAYISKYESLKVLIEAVLRTEVGRNIEGEATLFGKPIGRADLSEGQRVLLQLIVAVHANGSKLDRIILVMDEPENHLHPGVLIDVLCKLEEVAPNTQIWMATHSVPLLAYIASREPMAIWSMDAGKVTNAGRHPERVLNALLGDEQGIERLIAFTGLPRELAAATFAAECLHPPNVAGHEHSDPQLSQICKLLRGRSRNVLDFGAGKGRLASAIAEAGCTEIRYSALDSETTHREECCGAISGLGKQAGDYFTDSAELIENASGTFDVVVMTNVLHEIEPTEWSDLFGVDGVVTMALKAGGQLLLVEDQEIPVGELAHQDGFFLLDTGQLKKLFRVEGADLSEERFVPSDAREGRLKAHLVARELLERVCPESIRSAIEDLRVTAMARVVSLRREEPSYKNGLLHGLWTQSLANACIYLESR